MEKVVVGYDGTGEAKDALALARVIARASDAKLYVTCVYEHEPLFQNFGKAEAEREEVLKRLFADAARELSYKPFEEYTATGSAAEGIASTVHGIGADLIVVGSSHQGKAGRIYPGSVGERLLHATGCAVAIAPRGFARRPEEANGVIGVAYDGRAESENALAFAAELAKDLHSAVRLIAVVPDAFGSGRAGFDAQFQRELRDDLSEKLKVAEEQLPAGLDVATVIDEGDPVEVLAQRSANVDMLVVGSRAYGPVGYALLGGVSYRLAREAQSPVIVVPKGTGVKSAAERQAAAV